MRSNASSMDQVFEEEEEEEVERKGVGVEPVLSTSYSANDVNHLGEEGHGRKHMTPSYVHTHSHTTHTSYTHPLFSPLSVTKTSEPGSLLKVNGGIPGSRSIPYQLSEQKDTLLHVPDFMSPKTPGLELTMSPRGTTSFEFESVNLHKGILGSSESLQSTGSN